MQPARHLWALLVALALPAFAQEAPPGALRPPAVPLIVHDPYFSVWSTSETLTDRWSTHWTGANMAMCGMARIDGKAWRFLGPAPAVAEPMKQVELRVEATTTHAVFEAGGVRLALGFVSPVLPEEPRLAARPATYVEMDVRAIDDQTHRVELYFDCSAEWTVDRPSQKVAWSRFRLGELEALRLGSQEQSVLSRAGDDLRIDWGHLYLCAPSELPSQDPVQADNDYLSRATNLSGNQPGDRRRPPRSTLVSDATARGSFLATGRLPESDDLRMPRAASDAWPVAALAFELDRVDRGPVRRHLILAYDDVRSIELDERRLRPYWRSEGSEAADMLQAAEREHEALLERCAAFDRELRADLEAVGGSAHADLCLLAFRQTLGAHKIAAGPRGEPLMFPKENFSNGCISTVDVIYPSAPFFLLFNPALLEAQLVPLMEYAGSGRWKHPFAPHDLGTYPLANGQVYGGGEKTEENQMPVEESGNMLILAAALAKVQGDPSFAERYWPLFQQWAKYLAEKGLDPENQLCTDDFAGHLAHNANLSLKAILALGAYAQLCERLGWETDAARYRRMAEDMAAAWQDKANDGDHFRLAFDQPGTWSQKYNLVWDQWLGLKLFPPEVAAKELAFYKTKLQRYGLPLDSRKTYTKLDWAVWTATLAPDRATFEAFVDPLARFANDTPDRVPLTDWFETPDARHVGFQGRSVVGGVFIKLLFDETLAAKWRKRAKAR